jgi:hypothetical protein
MVRSRKIKPGCNRCIVKCTACTSEKKRRDQGCRKGAQDRKLADSNGSKWQAWKVSCRTSRRFFQADISLVCAIAKFRSGSRGVFVNGPKLSRREKGKKERDVMAKIGVVGPLHDSAATALLLGSVGVLALVDLEGVVSECAR